LQPDALHAAFLSSSLAVKTPLKFFGVKFCELAIAHHIVKVLVGELRVGVFDCEDGALHAILYRGQSALTFFTDDLGCSFTANHALETIGTSRCASSWREIDRTGI
jgi:hypothetical protein